MGLYYFFEPFYPPKGETCYKILYKLYKVT